MQNIEKQEATPFEASQKMIDYYRKNNQN